MARVKPLIEVLRGVTRFGRLTVLSEAPRIVSPSGFAALAASVRCDCGTEKVVRAGDLKNGYTTSCGCHRHEKHVSKLKAQATHGHTRDGKRSSEYGIWGGMKQRCQLPTYHSYADYGGRGITVCARWSGSFEAFLADMGPRPSTLHSLERKDNDGHYEPGNVRWATKKEQANNRRSSRMLTIDNETRTVTEWARSANTDPMLVFARLKKGWSERDAVFRGKRGSIHA